MKSFDTNCDRIQCARGDKPYTVYTRIKYRRKKCRKSSTLEHRKRKLWLLGITAIAFLLVLWTIEAERQARYLPQYNKINIEQIIHKPLLTEEDYIMLFAQTGLAAVAVDNLRLQAREEELLLVQEKFFADVPISCRANTIISREERIADRDVLKEAYRISSERAVRRPQENNAYIPYVEDGDILITFNSHVLGWRNGHAAIVVDAQKRLTLEARVLGTDSAVTSMAHWERYPSFVVLRLKGAEESERREIAAYAARNMLNKPYRLTAGWGDWMYPQNMTEGTQCAHLVWQAYQQFGYNLDSDGGLIVTPKDLFESSLLEIVQVYGMPILP